MTAGSSISSKLLSATLAHFVSKRDHALAKQLSEAEEALKTLETHFHY